MNLPFTIDTWGYHTHTLVFPGSMLVRNMVKSLKTLFIYHVASSNKDSSVGMQPALPSVGMQPALPVHCFRNGRMIWKHCVMLNGTLPKFS